VWFLDVGFFFMPGLVPGIHVFLVAASNKTWMAGIWASGSDAVVRTAVPGHDGRY
jgi:hypothetical protein